MIWAAIKDLVRKESAISSVEYALLLALIGLVTAAAAAGLGDAVGQNMDQATTTLTP